MGSPVRAGVIGHGAEETRYGVVAWLREGLLLEKCRYAPGPAEELPKQSHNEYQIRLSLDFPGVYGYRGATHAVPVGSLSVVHPGEVHSARDPQERLAPSSFRMMYAEPALLARAAAEVTGRREAQPFFHDPVILDESLAWDFLRLHVALEGGRPGARTGRASGLHSDAARGASRGGPPRASSRPGAAGGRVGPGVPGGQPRAERAAGRARQPGKPEPVPPGAGLPGRGRDAPARLPDAGAPASGRRARSLLLRGWPPARVAHQTGFADQSHLTRRFKRLVGVTPGRYAGRRSKNVQYAGVR